MTLSLLALEAGFRWHKWRRLTFDPLAGGYPDEITYQHPLYHHRYYANVAVKEWKADYDVVYTTNDLGLRGARRYGPKPAGVKRLLMLGDSFTFGIGVNDDEPFSAVIQQEMDPRRARIEVINAGVGSYSPILHYLTLRDLYLPLEPDAVILWFDVTDLQDDYLYERHLRYDAQGRLVACNSDYVRGHRDWVRPVLRRSAMANYFYSKFAGTYEKIGMLGWRAYLGAKLRGDDTKLNAVHMTAARRAHVDLLKYDRLLMVRGLATPAELERYWERTGGYLLRIQDLLRARDIPFALGLYPNAVQVGPNQWAEGRVYRMFDKGRTYDDPFPFTFIEAFARAHDIPVINTTPAFLAARDQELYYRWDGHFTPAGHRVLASHLLRDPTFRRLIETF